MKKILCLLVSLVIAATAAAQVTAIDRVQTIAQLKTYSRASAYVLVADSFKLYTPCTSCTADEVTVFAGTSSRKWKVLSSEYSHNHDDRYNTKAEITTLLSGKANTSHSHNDLYYTESETDALLLGKSSTSHIHDERYFTETETNTLLTGYSLSNHNHSGVYQPANAQLDVLAGLTSTTVGRNLLTLANPSAVTFLQINADNTITALNATSFRTAIGAISGTHTHGLADITGMGTGVSTFLGTPSSSNLIAAITDETGTGALVFANSPTFTGTVTLPSTTSIGTVSSTEIGYLDNVTSSIQTQINGKAASAHTHLAADISNLATGVGTFLATSSSANLAAALTDETGFGTVVFSTMPVLTDARLTGITRLEYDNTNYTDLNSTLDGKVVVTHTGGTAPEFYFDMPVFFNSDIKVPGGTQGQVLMIDENGNLVPGTFDVPPLIDGTYGHIGVTDGGSNWQINSAGYTAIVNYFTTNTALTAAMFAPGEIVDPVDAVVNGNMSPVTSNAVFDAIAALGGGGGVTAGDKGDITVTLGPENWTIDAGAVDVSELSGAGTGVLTFLATASSANLATAITDETGTGTLVFSASPTFTGTISANAITATGTIISGNLQTNSSLTNANFGSISTTATTTSVSQLQVNGSTNISFRRLMRGSSTPTIPVNDSYFGTIVGIEAQTEAASGTHGTFGGFAFLSPTLAQGAGSTTTGANVYIQGKVGGTATFAGNNWALWVDNDDVKFDGGLIVDGATQVGPTSALSSGSIESFVIGGTVNHSGSAQSTGLFISPYYQASGSGGDFLIAAGTRTAAYPSGTHSNLFVVDNTGYTWNNQGYGSSIKTTDPARSAGVIKMFHKLLANRGMGRQVGPDSLSNYFYQPFWGLGRIGFTSANFGTTTLSNLGAGSNVAEGTASVLTMGSTQAGESNSTYTFKPRVRVTSASAAANQPAGYRSVGHVAVLGNTLGEGGFFAVFQGGMAQFQTGSKGFMGFSASGDIPNTVTISTMDNMVGMAYDNQTTWRIVSNDASDPGTEHTDLGANFPTNVDDDGILTFAMYAPSNQNSNVYWYARRVTNAGVVYESSGTISSDLPLVETPLYWHSWLNTGTAVTNVIWDFMSVYVEVEN
jgi:hypothetical protein